MPNFDLYMVMVSGVPEQYEEDCEFTQAYNKAKELFDEDLVPPLTCSGHNSMQSFCVYPSFSGVGREPQVTHQNNMNLFCEYLSTKHMDWFCVHWDEGKCEKPVVIKSSEEY